jgi:MATE family multidrug resistance protein
MGIVRGLSHTKLISIGGFIGYFCIAIPTSAVLAFKFDLGLFGLWLGLIFGSIFMNIYNKWLCIIHLDWEQVY